MGFNQLEKIIKLKLCMGCGACEIVCTKNLIEIGLGGMPKFKGDKYEDCCANCNDCSLACPGLDPKTCKSEKKLFKINRNKDKRWIGIYLKEVLAVSTNQKIKFNSSRGGSTTEILKASMEYLDLTCMVVLGKNTTNPWLAEPKACYSAEGLSEYTQSIYQICKYITVLKDIIYENSINRIGIVALPCQVQAIRKIQDMNSKIGKLFREQIIFICEIACSTNTTYKGTETLIEKCMGIPLEIVSQVSYRDGNYPGTFTVCTKTGEKKKLPIKYAFEHFTKYKYFRCLSCGDWMSGLSDISICDGETSFSNETSLNKINCNQYNVIFARTELGLNILKYCQQNNSLKIWNHDENVEETNIGLQKKMMRRKYYKSKNLIIPKGPLM